MTTFVCSISNESPEHPVVSPVSGCVYERRLIEKYLDENGTDPVSGKPVSKDDLIEVKASPLVKPKPPSATSIPAILKSLQDEWDSVMLHSFTLRQQLQTARQELSHALYQHDAACRVIARLTKEVTAAREALATLKPQQAALPATPSMAGSATPSMTPTPAQMEAAAMEPPSSAAAAAASAQMEPKGMTPEIVDKLQEKAKILTGERRKRSKMVPEELMPADSIRSFKTLASHPGLHSAGAPGILALDIHPNNTSKILTGGADKTAAVFNKDDEQVVAILKGHSKKVSRVVYHPDGGENRVITASHDCSVRIWDVPTSQTIQCLRVHEGPVTGLSLHATGDYILTTSTDQHWAFSDLRSGQLITKVTDQGQESGGGGGGLTCAQFHPDGLILGTGTSDSIIKIWDLKEQRNVANFEGHSGQISALSFSENGYYLATAADDACVKLWDLRKLKNFKTIQLEDNYEVRDLSFDQSGTYLAVAGTDVRVYLCKQWTDLKVFRDHTAMATGVRFGRNAAYLASTSMDRTLKLYGLQ